MRPCYRTGQLQGSAYRSIATYSRQPSMRLRRT